MSTAHKIRDLIAQTTTGWGHEPPRVRVGGTREPRGFYVPQDEAGKATDERPNRRSA
jgi:hypothetical protein